MRPSIKKIREKLLGKPELVEQLTPLRECISTRWGVFARDGFFMSAPDCQLCEALGDPLGCDGCVINTITDNHCRGTPYDVWLHTVMRSDSEKEQAQQEVEFLRDIETVLLEMT